MEITEQQIECHSTSGEKVLTRLQEMRQSLSGAIAAQARKEEAQKGGSLIVGMNHSEAADTRKIAQELELGVRDQEFSNLEANESVQSPRSPARTSRSPARTSRSPTTWREVKEPMPNNSIDGPPKDAIESPRCRRSPPRRPAREGDTLSSYAMRTRDGHSQRASFMGMPNDNIPLDGHNRRDSLGDVVGIGRSDPWLFPPSSQPLILRRDSDYFYKRSTLSSRRRIALQGSARTYDADGYQFVRTLRSPGRSLARSSSEPPPISGLWSI